MNFTVARFTLPVWTLRKLQLSRIFIGIGVLKEIYGWIVLKYVWCLVLAHGSHSENVAWTTDSHRHEKKKWFEMYYFLYTNLKTYKAYIRKQRVSLQLWQGSRAQQKH